MHSSLTHPKTIQTFFVISALYLPAFFIVAWLSGHLYNLGNESLFFSSTDSIGYRAIADYYASLGNSERPSDDLLGLRTFLFPLYLGLYRLIGIAGVQVLQMMMNTASLWLVFVSLKSLSSRSWIAGVSTTLLALTPSFNFLVFHALTESLSIFLVCVFIALIVDHFTHFRQASLAIAALVVSILLCVRPIVLPFWIFFVAYYVICWLRDQKRRVWQLIAIMTPVLCQVILAFMMTGSAVRLSSIGGVGVSTWYFPLVYGQTEYGRFVGRKSPEAQEGLRRFPLLKDKLLYVTENYRAGIKVYLSILIGEHLLAGSNFVRVAGQADDVNRRVGVYLEKWSYQLSQVFACVHAIMFGVMVWLMVSMRKVPAEKAILVCYIFAILLIVPAAIVYMQGDRYVLLAEPLWLVAYGTLVALLINRWSGQLSTRPIWAKSTVQLLPPQR
jgi:hypothetical protein